MASYGELSYVITVDEPGGARQYPYRHTKRSPLSDGDVLEGQNLDGVVITEVARQARFDAPGEARGERRQSPLRRP